jgi:hypothetical protein
MVGIGRVVVYEGEAVAACTVSISPAEREMPAVNICSQADVLEAPNWPGPKFSMSSEEMVMQK